MKLLLPWEPIDRGSNHWASYYLAQNVISSPFNFSTVFGFLRRSWGELVSLWSECVEGQRHYTAEVGRHQSYNITLTRGFIQISTYIFLLRALISRLVLIICSRRSWCSSSLLRKFSKMDKSPTSRIGRFHVCLRLWNHRLILPRSLSSHGSGKVEVRRFEVSNEQWREVIRQ